MKKSLNLSVVAAFVLAALSYNVAQAKTSQQTSINNKDASSAKADDVRVFVNTQQRSLYQIALLSGISITELRKINKGEYDNVDVVKIGQSIVLPAHSSLLPAESKEIKKEEKYSNLPSLGSSDKIDVTKDDSMERQVATVLQTLGQQDWDNMSSEKIKQDLNNKTQDYAESYVRNQVHTQVIDPIRNAAQDFLGRFGTAQLQFDVSDQAKLNNINVKLFSPWYDSDRTLIFSQLTYQEYEKDRRIGNFGIGQRWDIADNRWLIGYNVFFDHDFGRNHNRLGLGLEAWSDYMKFAANYYTPLSDWKDSKDFDDYLERAARGFDIRFQGYLPSYPHLGASLMFEQYFGDKVALFGKDHLQKDPYAVTFGVDYTPVPLFTIKGEHKQGQDAHKMAKVELTMNYRLGVPLKDQLDPNMVQVARSLKGSRYDLVDRNNYIVLEYKEKKFSVDLASLGEFEEQTIVPVVISVHNVKGGLSALSWNNLTGSADLNALGLPRVAGNGDLCYNRGSSVMGTLCPAGNAWNETVGAATSDISNWSIRVPDYINATTGERNPTSLSGVSVPGRYTFDVTLTSNNGLSASSNTSWLSIKPSSTRRTVVVENVSPANPSGNALGSTVADAASIDGVTTVKLEAYLFDTSVLPAPGAGFNDASILANYPSAFDLDKINTYWSAVTHDGKTVKFVNGSASDAKCDVVDGTPESCLLVKSVQAVAGSPDKYQLNVATTAPLGEVTVTAKMSPYGQGTIPVYFSTTSGAAWLAIYDTSNGSMVAYGQASGEANSIVAVSSAANPFIVGKTYEARGYAVDPTTSGATPIANLNYVWSLVGDNIAACPSSDGVSYNTVLNDFVSQPNGPWFNVSTSNQYTIKGLVAGNVSMASNGSAGLTVGSQSWGASHPAASPQACAGDQGFKLQVTAY